MEETIIEKFIKQYGSNIDKISVIAEDDPSTFTLKLNANNMNFTLSNIGEETLAKFGISTKF